MAPGVDVLVATPGRLIDHMGQKTINLSETEIFVLDEADQMLDLGFFRPIRQIVGFMPKKRHNLFFSATMPSEIGKLAAELLVDPFHVSVTPTATTVERVIQKVIFIEPAKKRSLLAELFADDPDYPADTDPVDYVLRMMFAGWIPENVPTEPAPGDEVADPAAGVAVP